MPSLMPDPETDLLHPYPDEQNCPFYGRRLVRLGAPFTLIDTQGNQCALLAASHSPCYMVLEGLRIDWRNCRRVAAIQMDFRDEDRTA